MSKAPAKPPTKGQNNDDFRRRRLSLTDVDTSEFGNSGTSSPQAGGRARRLSMSPEMGVVKKANELPFPLEVVGTYSCHGVEPGQRQGETHAKINQDRGCVVYPYGPEGKYAMFCVYDGHGANGDKVAQFASQNVATLVEEKLNAGMKPPEALTKAFLEVDGKLKKDKSIDADLSGTTAVVIVYEIIDKTKGKLWAANCGDSRAVLQSEGKKTSDITEDQKPNTPVEQARITKCGGYVSPPEEEWGGPARVWLDENMTLPGLAMARSIGDHLVDRVGVVAEPVVTTFDIDTSKDEMLVMASDGVWEFIESGQAFEILNKAKKDSKGSDNATAEVTKLIETAAAKWRQEEGEYRDDITAICIKLKAMHGCHCEQSQ